MSPGMIKTPLLKRDAATIKKSCPCITPLFPKEENNSAGAKINKEMPPVFLFDHAIDIG